MAITKYDQFDFLIDIVPRCCISISILQDQTRILVFMNLPTQTFCPPGMTSSQPPRGRSQVFGWSQIRSVGKTLRSLLDTSKVSSWKSNICIVQCAGVLLLPTSPATSAAASAELRLPHPGSTSNFSCSNSCCADVLRFGNI